MTTEYMRDKVSSAFDSFRWRDKVARMSAAQVTAIYFSFKERGMFNKTRSKKRPEYRQMTIFDYI